MIILVAVTLVVVTTVAVARAASRTSFDDHERIAALAKEQLDAVAEVRDAVIAADQANRDGLARVVAAAAG